MRSQLTQQATERISIRTTPYTKQLTEQASALLGVSVSQFVASAIYEKSMQMLKDAQIWQLSEHDAELVNVLLSQADAPNEELKALLAVGESLAEV